MKPTGATKEATGHSPLPWLVPDSDFEKVCTGDGLTIADTYDRRRPDLSLPKPVREANAQLIVAAVNERERLRELAQDFRKWLVQTNADGTEYTVWPEWVQRIDAALNEAEG